MTFKGVTIYDKLSEINALQFDVQYNRPGEQRLRGGNILLYSEMSFIRNAELNFNCIVSPIFSYFSKEVNGLLSTKFTRLLVSID